MIHELEQKSKNSNLNEPLNVPTMNHDNSINKTILSIPGIGEKAHEALARLKIKQVKDLILHLPNNIIARKLQPKWQELSNGDQVILTVKIVDFSRHNFKVNRRQPFRIFCTYLNKPFSLLYFNYYPQYLIDKLKIDQDLTVCGKFEIFNNEFLIVHPEINSSQKNFNPIQVIYPLTYGITNNQLVKYIDAALAKVTIPEGEWLPSEIIAKNNWQSFKDSLFSLHHPLKIGGNDQSRRRIAYDELLANQISAHKFRSKRTKELGRSFSFSSDLAYKITHELGYELTSGQIEALNEIIADQRAPYKMYRLIQGDVGCGKTLVALLAIANILEAGDHQCAFMAPTDILANQHYNWIKPILAKYGIETTLLTGKITGKKRKDALEKIANNQAKVIIGTHAIFQEHVEFSDLALIIIDEQHRFGVEQRVSLVNKGKQADILSMSATPIPRTLTLALYGDMEISRILDKPKGRIEIETLLLSVPKAPALIDSFHKLINEGERIYWICPLIEASEDDEITEKVLKAAIDRKQELEKIFPGIVGLVHGKMSATEKEENLNRFAKGDDKILVATTVIEVGINIPEATIMVIEQAERFGLSQLHQLRGRVGRGSKKSYCFLLYSFPISQVGLARLNCLKQSSDGFYIAEQDLILRGAGDIVGKKQSGFPEFKIAVLPEDGDLLIAANKHAKQIVEDNKITPELQYILRLFSYDEEWRG